MLLEEAAKLLADGYKHYPSFKGVGLGGDHLILYVSQAPGKTIPPPEQWKGYQVKTQVLVKPLAF